MIDGLSFVGAGSHPRRRSEHKRTDTDASVLMPTSAECRTKARELTARAGREPRHKTKHLVDAEAWLVLASRTEEVEKQDPTAV